MLASKVIVAYAKETEGRVDTMLLFGVVQWLYHGVPVYVGGHGEGGRANRMVAGVSISRGK